jgi:hypothetical protein
MIFGIGEHGISKVLIAELVTIFEEVFFQIDVFFVIEHVDSVVFVSLWELEQ